MKLSDYVIHFLEEYDVKNVFMLSGGGCMHLVDSLGKSKKIKYICPLHEQSVSMAAEAMAKYTNKLAVALVTSGPGGTNAITGLAGAHLDSTPCLFISGQSKRKQTVANAEIDGLRQFGAQEIDIIPVVKSLTKYAQMITNPNDIRYHLEKAVYLACEGRPGSVWLDIPLDIQGAIINEQSLRGFVPPIPVQTKIEEENSFQSFIEALKSAKRPVILAGHGVRLANASDELREFSEEFNIPVVTTILGIDVLSTEHSNNIGRVGIRGTRAGNFTVQNADVLLVLGSRLSVQTIGHEYDLFAREAKIFVVDIDENEHKKNTVPIETIICCDVKDFLTQSKNKIMLDTAITKEWLQFCQKQKSTYPVCLDQYEQDKNGINFYKLIDVITQNMSPHATIISDAGSTFYVVSQAAKIKGEQRYITSGALATMGFSIPAAIGVAVADSKRPVIAVTGDGSFQMNLQELALFNGYHLNVKLFVINNGGYFSIHQTQKRLFHENYVGESSQSGVFFPAISDIADAYKLRYERIEKTSELLTKIEEILSANEPIIVEILADQTMEIQPSNTAKMKPDGTMVSSPLEDMYPFLSKEELLSNLLVKPVDE